ncbi:cell adhesion molecule 3-like [Carcharodon carcharias]|uniref:cell adhesion molecule 3-like n=1 Tax=Carcharodon carcharias TaxID=13397 RepID=UPI001B7E3AF4|nr:cell adhesion molecule 3-like [Carcharodon carcharias]
MRTSSPQEKQGPQSRKRTYNEWLYPVTQDEIAHEHGTVTLKCTVQENDNSSLQWSNPAQQTLYFDGKKALRDSRIQLVNYTSKELTISISNMTLNDEGIYTCSIFTFPVLTATARVQVLGVPKKPEITGYRGAVPEGTIITLTCNTTGSKPAATIHWFKGTEELTGHVTHREDSAARTYAVSSQVNITVTREDNGIDIVCSVDHETLDPNAYRTPQRIEVYCEYREAELLVTECTHKIQSHHKDFTHRKQNTALLFTEGIRS